MQAYPLKMIASGVLLAGFAYLPADAQLLKAIRIARNNQPPAFPFDPRKAPPAPDYTRPANWSALPDKSDEADVTPDGVAATDQHKADVDVFFIYPTVLMSRTQWNADVGDAALNRQIDTTTVRSQASVFNGCCAVYAPRYRQMTLGGYIKWSGNSMKASELAYSDVARAFRQFLAWNKGRPFIIAGHSQGSRLGRLLIEREIDGKPIVRRMVAAYLIGHWIEADWFRGLKSVRACQRSNDTGCVVTWSTYEEGRDAAFQRRNLGIQSKYPPEQLRRPYVGINPLTWTTDGTTATRTANFGSWLYGPGQTPRPVDPGLVSARYKDGAVYVSKGSPKIYTDLVIPFGNYHNLDYSMFWMNLRENTRTRIDAFWKR